MLEDLTPDELAEINRLPSSYRGAMHAILTRHEKVWLDRVAEVEAARDCHYPGSRDSRGNISHARYLGEMEGYGLTVCTVCGNVTAGQPIAMAAGSESRGSA